MTIEESLKEAGIGITRLGNQFIFAVNLSDNLTKSLKISTKQMLNDPAKKDHSEQLAGVFNFGSQTKVNLKTSRMLPHWEEFFDTIEKISYSYVEYFNEKCINSKIPTSNFVCKINDMWINEQLPGDYNPLHCHNNESMAGLSGVFYVSIPKEIREGKADSGKINFVYGTQRQNDHNNFRLAQTVQVNPQPGGLLLFPQDMNHSVTSFVSEESRISIAFNVNVWYKDYKVKNYIQ
ncbi:MAG: hypothetical protein CBC29_06915 [Methylococcaceae bacterium TMED69]|mgnify:CR=1 FL=1|nr:MAG: hypothetical protein CBC29_06915 [Methylococcaceae bacterium TMED69]|tara:strand:- start:647 stop:1351 length:705 start_codon:yes stop_codon:yes gene_type:complete